MIHLYLDRHSPSQPISSPTRARAASSFMTREIRAHSPGQARFRRRSRLSQAILHDTSRADSIVRPESGHASLWLGDLQSLTPTAFLTVAWGRVERVCAAPQETGLRGKFLTTDDADGHGCDQQTSSFPIRDIRALRGSLTALLGNGSTGWHMAKTIASGVGMNNA